LETVYQFIRSQLKFGYVSLQVTFFGQIGVWANASCNVLCFHITVWRNATNFYGKIRTGKCIVTVIFWDTHFPVQVIGVTNYSKTNQIQEIVGHLYNMEK